MKLPISIFLIIYSSCTLSAQNTETKEFNNAIEMTVGLASNGTSRISGPYFNLKYKRSVYKDVINNFSIGLLGHRSNFNLGTSFLSNGNFNNLRLIANHEINSAGILLSNRFSGDLKKMRLFMDLELSGLYQLSASQETEIREGFFTSFGGYGGYGGYIGYGGYGGNNSQDEYTVENQPDLTKFVCYFSLSAGMEIKVGGQRRFYYSLGMSRNINSFYQPTYVSEFLPILRDVFFFSGSLNVGYRF